MKEPRHRTKAEQTFIEQLTREKLVRWCEFSLETELITLDSTNPCVRYAADRKSPWISDKGDGKYKVLSTGFAVAASFLKR